MIILVCMTKFCFVSLIRKTKFRTGFKEFFLLYDRKKKLYPVDGHHRKNLGKKKDIHEVCSYRVPSFNPTKLISMIQRK